jgi:hypothetical protein|nr:MAG TPA: hypothetical protein [Caudoviricetes sp.]
MSFILSPFIITLVEKAKAIAIAAMARALDRPIELSFHVLSKLFPSLLDLLEIPGDPPRQSEGLKISCGLEPSFKMFPGTVIVPDRAIIEFIDNLSQLWFPLTSEVVFGLEAEVVKGDLELFEHGSSFL